MPSGKISEKLLSAIHINFYTEIQKYIVIQNKTGKIYENCLVRFIK